MSYFCLLLSFRLNAISLASLNVNVKIEIFVLVAGFIFKEWNAGCTIRMVGRLRSLSLEFLILASMAHVAVFAAKETISTENCTFRINRIRMGPSKGTAKLDVRKTAALHGVHRTRDSVHLPRPVRSFPLSVKTRLNLI